MDSATFIKKKLLDATKNKSDKNAREYYWNCIKEYGYSEELISNPYLSDSEDSDSSDDEYSAFEEYSSGSGSGIKSKNKKKRINEYYSPGEISYSETQHLTLQNERTQRTFIQPGDNSLINRLSELNTWTSVTSEDNDLRKVNEIIDFALNNIIKTQDYKNIQKLALNMYYNILKYYASNLLNLQSNQGNLKKGFIVLVIYYSLVYFKMNVGIEQIISLVPDARLSQVPKAREYIELIFEGNDNYSFIFDNPEQEYVKGLCGLEKLLPAEVIFKINKVKNQLIAFNIFSSPLSGIQIAACIYFVTSLGISKGGITQKRLTVNLNGVDSNITMRLLSTTCGPSFAEATLTKNVKIIADFYKKNRGLITS